MPRSLLSGELLRVVAAMSDVECAVRIGSGAVGQYRLLRPTGCSTSIHRGRLASVGK